jgi:puromycin-sensitive aminopeptidase
MGSTTYRLPRAVIPVDYDVTLDASPRRSGFAGNLVLTARVAQPTASFELNVIELSVSDVSARVAGKKVTGKARRHPDRETVELVFPRELPRGKVVVSLTFKGKLNPSMHGLYLAKDGADRAVVSQCEAPDARRIFPCFDEPDLKATVKWTVRTDPGLTVITNGVAAGRSRARGTPVREVHVFKRTRVIPSYLFAVTIGEFEATRVKRVAGVPCRVVTGPGKLGQTGFAEAVTSFVLPWYEDYFGQRYNYQKLDQVAVPGFDAGAMENVGAIFYRQSVLLMAPGTTSWHAQKRIAEVVAHEIAHQWFGNLVTMKWWDDLWLNEAFATWIAFKVTDRWKPEWRIWDEYLFEKEGALEADALVNTHPIYAEVKTPAEATELFDVITYEKGGGVLRMAESYLGEERFKDGIRRYQAAFKNGNAAGRDLWQKLGEASGEPVDELMQSWIGQPGFPLVTVSASEEGGNTVLHLSQRRFFASPGELSHDRDQTWPIPLLVRYDAGDGPRVERALLRDREGTVTLLGRARWVFPNDRATGFYRVRLSDELLSGLLREGLASLDPASRMSLIDDQWALVRAGLSDIERFMDILEAFRGERDYAVVRVMASRLGWLEQRLVSDADRDLLRDFARWLLRGQLDELGWDAAPDEGEARAVRRAAVINALGDTGREAAVLDEAEARVHVEMADPRAVDPNLAGVAAALGALRGGRERLDEYVSVFLARKKERAAPELQARYLGALGYFEDPRAAKKVLSLCLDGTVPQEQLRTVLTPLLTRRATQRETWAFLKKSWTTLGPRVGLMGVSRLVEATGALPVDLADDVAAFFAKNPVDEAKRALAKALEAMALRRELLAREGPRLSRWLRQRGERAGVAG